ncbi:hypothetical protein F6R98_10745 [Candidatus Methylospira mobilis]|uniref:Uncharacterized protein n=1 Tax=Candidatus Methylospira mobilis TaxID=1808979 RepID=A0A5Q0BGP6_9GAMM|nr:hypothetical protein [Candidatus Methylospira mobilis]QFY43035.1 hypothetical protein F6R98_10745 [Candidatus Methylospira mobilis]
MIGGTPVETLGPLRNSFVVDEVESELRQLFLDLYDAHLSPQVADENVLGVAHLGSMELLNRAMQADGLALPNRGNALAYQYLYRAWKGRNSGRGLEFLRTAMQLIWPTGWELDQMMQLKSAPYPAALSPASTTGNDDDKFLTSRVRVLVDNTENDFHDIDQLAPLLRTTTPARITLYFSILNRMKIQPTAGAAIGRQALRSKISSAITGSGRIQAGVSPTATGSFSDHRGAKRDVMGRLLRSAELRMANQRPLLPPSLTPIMVTAAIAERIQQEMARIANSTIKAPALVAGVAMHGSAVDDPNRPSATISAQMRRAAGASLLGHFTDQTRSVRVNGARRIAAGVRAHNQRALLPQSMMPILVFEGLSLVKGGLRTGSSSMLERAYAVSANSGAHPVSVATEQHTVITSDGPLQPHCSSVQERVTGVTVNGSEHPTSVATERHTAAVCDSGISGLKSSYEWEGEWDGRYWDGNVSFFYDSTTG